MPFTVRHPPDTAERVEGVPFYRLATYAMTEELEAHTGISPFAFSIRAFDVLPPSDAVGLLSGIDSTGLIVWGGALAFVEWMVRQPQRLRNLVTSHDCRGVCFIELGCGCGVVTVALVTLIRRLRAATAEEPAQRSRVFFCATDGNPACVELTKRNIAERCDATRPDASELTVEATLLRWGDETAVHGELQRFLHPTETTSLIIVSADVIYDASAVPLLVDTVSAIAQVYWSSANVEGQRFRREWWLTYTPRSLTRQENERIFQSLLDAIEKRRWTVEIFALPAHIVETGFEGCSDSAQPALLGCILVVHLGEAPPLTSLGEAGERIREVKGYRDR